MSAHCPSCCQEVPRVKRENGSWYPPLEFVQVGLVIGRDDGVLRPELVWQQHCCPGGRAAGRPVGRLVPSRAAGPDRPSRNGRPMGGSTWSR